MTTLYDLYETDTALENEGAWVEITSELKIKVAALGNKAHQEAIEKFFKPYKAQKRSNMIDDTLEEELHTKAIAKAILIDWQGMTDRKGKELPYSFENAYFLLSDPAMRRFKNDVIMIAKEAETFKNKELEESVKN
jgi:hypothetical protein